MEDHSADPIHLQDLCLLVIINNLNTYPVSLLASLPRWFRHRLLSYMPLVDLCLLDHSPVAWGIDISEIWKTRSRRVNGRMIPTSWVAYTHFEIPMHGFSGQNGICHQAGELEGLEPKLEQALQSHQKDYRTKYLMHIALSLLHFDDSIPGVIMHPAAADSTTGTLSLLEAITRECVSINGNLLLQNLMNASDISYNLPSYTIRRNHTNLLTKHFLKWELGIPMSMLRKDDIASIELTPQRYTMIRDRANRYELMTLVTQTFGLNMPSIHLNFSKLKCLSGPQVHSFLEYLLRDVQILGIYNGPSVHMVSLDAEQDSIGVQTIMEYCVGSGVKCQLGALYCDLRKVDICHLSPYIFTLPNSNDIQPCYVGLSVLQFNSVDTHLKLMHTIRLIQQHLSLKYVNLDILGITDGNYPESAQCFTALASLFHQPQFQVLHLICHHMKNQDLLTLLVHGFILAPCFGNQQLSMFVPNNVVMPKNYLFNVALPPHKKYMETVPDCGIEHKRLLHYMHNPLLHSCSVLEVLFQFPSIRLKDLVFECVPDASGNYPFLHLAALHPDL